MKKINWIKILKRLVISYFAYLIVFGALIFIIKPSKTGEELELKNLRGREEGQERVVLVEDRYESYLSRMDLIEEAEDSIDIAYYTIHDGRTTRAFFGSLIDAANRGVKVRIVLDGMFNHLRGDLRGLIHLAELHPNMELKFYETVKPFKPWTLNNRLHDKFIIIDGKKFLLGGRNIGDKYFLEDYDQNKQVRDRDVMVLGRKGEGALGQLSNYFDRLWKSDYSQEARMSSLFYSKARARELEEDLLLSYEKEKRDNKDLAKTRDYESLSLPTRKVSIVSNPLTRLNKYPLAFETIVRLASTSRTMDVQSPYVLPTRLMKSYSKDQDIDYGNTRLYTNSEYASPNPFAMAGYIKVRKNIVDSGVELFEYQAPGSIHGKSYVFDKSLSVVGSVNMDNRSAFLSTETMVIIDSDEFGQELLGAFEKIGENSFRVGRDYKYLDGKEGLNKTPIYKYILIRFLSIFTQFFDYML